MKNEEFWCRCGVSSFENNNITFPEGFNLGEEILPFLDSSDSIIDVGCGLGRIASVFNPAQYTGIDINELAIHVAKSRFPDYKFNVFYGGYFFPFGDVVVLNNVCLYISDVDIANFLKRVATSALKKLVICEIMDARWRKKTTPVLYNRSAEVYKRLMRPMQLVETKVIPHKIYSESWFYKNLNVSKDVSIMFFDTSRQ